MNIDIRLFVSIAVLLISVYLIHIGQITYGIALLGTLLGYVWGKNENEAILKLKSAKIKWK